MSKNEKHTGSRNAFNKNWQARPETHYNHWTRGKPRNQVQLAFRRHWITFKKLLDGVTGGRCLEIGCGRGSMSGYFADAGFDCTLADYSHSVIETASEIFEANSLDAGFVCGDACRLPFSDNAFDVCVSIGLLEHFEEVRQPLSEQARVLRPGGVMLAYIVPEHVSGTQKKWNFVNDLLKFSFRVAGRAQLKGPPKEDVFRSDFGSAHYLDAMSDLPFQIIEVTGIYSMPMISHSPEFPFTLLPAQMEKTLVRIFNVALETRSLQAGDPWTCPEPDGQAFLIAARKTQ